MQNFTELCKKKFLDVKSVYIRGLRSKASLEQIRLKAFGKRSNKL